VSLKEARLALLENCGNFRFARADLADKPAMEALFASERPEIVVNLAAQAGVRYSLENPHAYVESNLVGFLNVLEGCRRQRVRHLLFASSSSVYGANTRMPFSVHDNVDHPLSLYAATKKANELMAHSYAALYRLPARVSASSTVYGPWGRPDMALFLFTRAILEGRPIDVFNEGRMKRDFTYIDDIVEGLVRVLERIPAPDAAWRGDRPDPSISFAPTAFTISEQPAGRADGLHRDPRRPSRPEGKQELSPPPGGDVPATFADVDDLMADVGSSRRRPSPRDRTVCGLVPGVLPLLTGQIRFFSVDFRTGLC